MSVETTLDVLPDKPSDLILLALEDLEKVEKDPAYEIAMGEWHTYGLSKPNVCQVCLAGSVMAKSLGTDIKRSTIPGCFDQSIKNKLRALNFFRCGEIASGVYLFDYNADWGKIKEQWPVREQAPDYIDLNPGPFKQYMRDLAARLKEKGL